MREAVLYEGRSWATYQILNTTWFKYVKWIKGRKFVVALYLLGLWYSEQYIKFENRVTQIYYLIETWINQNHSKKSCWQVSDKRWGSGLQWGKKADCHVGFLPDRKSISHTRSKDRPHNHFSMGRLCQACKKPARLFKELFGDDMYQEYSRIIIWLLLLWMQWWWQDFRLSVQASLLNFHFEVIQLINMLHVFNWYHLNYV